MTPALPGPVLLPTVMQMYTNCDIANRYSKGMLDLRSTNVQSQLVIKILTKRESATTQLVSNAQHTHVISYSLSSFIAFDAPRDSDIFMADCDMVSESSDILIDFCALNLFSPPSQIYSPFPNIKLNIPVVPVTAQLLKQPRHLYLRCLHHAHQNRQIF